MKSLMKIAAVAALCAPFLAPVTVTAEIDPVVAEAIRDRVQRANPKMQLGELKESPMPGIFQAEVVGNGTVYISKDGGHFVFGDLFRVSDEGLVNLSELKRLKTRADTMAGLNIDDMIVFSPAGEAKAHIYVFTDVDCGYCVKLHQDVPKLNKMGIEVRYLAYPRAGLNSVAYRKIATAWCSDDRNATLTRLKNRENISISVCDKNPIAEQLRLGDEVIGVRGTPTIVMQDGTVVPGYIPPETMAKALGI